MTARAAAISTATVPIDALAVLELRSWARAYLFAVGELELADAVDTLQAFAVESGLVGRLGQDAVQMIIGCAFDEVRP